jgi:hypothetical protein
MSDSLPAHADPVLDRLLELLLVTDTDLPYSADLAGVPFIVPVLRQPRTKEGRLQESAYRLVLTVRGPRGIEATVVVQGDQDLGLGYGFDHEVWVALVAVFLKRARQDPEVFRTGLIQDVPVREIVREMGREWDSAHAKRVYETIRRFSGTNFRFDKIIPHDPRVEDDGVLVPGSTGRSFRREESVTHFLMMSSLVKEQRGDQEVTLIRWLRIDPIWLRQAAAGWAAWLRRDVVSRMEQLLSHTLYPLLASQAAFATPQPWQTTLGELCERRGIPLSDTGNSTPGMVLKRIGVALDELVRLDVLSGWEQEGRGRKAVLILRPGPVLASAAALRGATALDEPVARKLLMAAERLGLTQATARRAAEEQPQLLRDVVAYAIYRDQRGEISSSTASFIQKLLKEGFNPRSDPSFLKWLAELQRGATGPAAAEPPMLPAPAGLEERSTVAPARPLAPPVSVPDADPAAERLLDALREALEADPSWPPPSRVAMAHLGAAAIDGDRLVCFYTNDLYAKLIRRAADRTAPALEAASGGVARVLELREARGAAR